MDSEVACPRGAGPANAFIHECFGDATPASVRLNRDQSNLRPADSTRIVAIGVGFRRVEHDAADHRATVVRDYALRALARSERGVDRRAQTLPRCGLHDGRVLRVRAAREIGDYLALVGPRVADA